jgi:hypothetical protein
LLFVSASRLNFGLAIDVVSADLASFNFQHGSDAMTVWKFKSNPGLVTTTEFSHAASTGQDQVISVADHGHCLF